MKAEVPHVVSSVFLRGSSGDFFALIVIKITIAVSSSEAAAEQQQQHQQQEFIIIESYVWRHKRSQFDMHATNVFSHASLP